MIQMTANTAKAKRLMTDLNQALGVQQIDKVVERIAFKALGSVVKDSPKHWFGQIRSGWRVIKPGPGSRLVMIPANNKSVTGTSVRDIARFTEFGTANNGTGYIYPKRKKFLYIPLKRTAVRWHASLERGKDFVLVRRVRGQKGQGYIAKTRNKYRVLALVEIRAYLNGRLKRSIS